MLMQLPPGPARRRQYVIYGGILHRIDMITDHIPAVRTPGQLPIRLLLIPIRGILYGVAAARGTNKDIVIF
jgi:hypothetical protein